MSPVKCKMVLASFAATNFVSPHKYTINFMILQAGFSLVKTPTHLLALLTISKKEEKELAYIKIAISLSYLLSCINLNIKIA